MRFHLHWVFSLLLILSRHTNLRLARPLAQNSSPNVRIRQPAGGEAVQGAVQIIGNANPVDFVEYEISFGYSQDTTGTWFVIAEGSEPVRNTVLAEWDTFVITDGTYNLRLQISLADGTQLEDLVEGVRVRNYSPVETGTPAPSPTASSTPTPDLTAMFTPFATITLTPFPTVQPSHTPLPLNPAEFRPGAIPLSMARGVAGVMAAFLLGGLYSSLRRARRK